jgi:hypothetical protein
MMMMMVMMTIVMTTTKLYTNVMGFNEGWYADVWVTG